MLVNEVLKHLQNIPEDNFPQVLREEDGSMSIYCEGTKKTPVLQMTLIWFALLNN